MAYDIDADKKMFSSKAGASVPRLQSQSIDSNEDLEMDFDDQHDYMDHNISAGQLLTAHSGPISQFSNGMPDWMNMTLEDINLAVESLPNRLERHILPEILLQEASTWQWRASLKK
jgi:hypothetical protein